MTMMPPEWLLRGLEQRLRCALERLFAEHEQAHARFVDAVACLCESEELDGIAIAHTLRNLGKISFHGAPFIATAHADSPAFPAKHHVSAIRVKPVPAMSERSASHVKLVDEQEAFHGHVQQLERQHPTEHQRAPEQRREVFKELPPQNSKINQRTPSAPEQQLKAYGARRRHTECLRATRDDRMMDHGSSAIPSRPAAPDSCAILNDLDFLTSAEWQTMPEEIPNAFDEQLVKEARTAEPAKVYQIALRSLWYNCPDALEVALSRVDGVVMSDEQAQDAQFMRQKLEFTRIRQCFVASCIQLRAKTTDREGSLASFRAGVSAVEERCTILMAAQPDESTSQLPGLITKRDTLMLRTRIQTIATELLAQFGCRL